MSFKNIGSIVSYKIISDSLKENKKKFNFTIVPLRLYIKDSLAKIEIALAKGKKLYDKRKSIAEKDIKRKIEKRHKIRV